MRELSKNFMAALKKGLLYPILKLVKGDLTLCLEIREDYVNIYYRGGNILRIKREANCYNAFFDTKYLDKKTTRVPKRLPRILGKPKDVSAWINAIPFLKHEMDLWFGRHPKDEREFQQLILRENNGSNVGNSTDYFIIDIEYDNHKGACFDLVAVEWESKSIIRKLNKGYKPKLCFIEVKYGDNALSGTAGMLKHIKDFKSYLDSSDNLKIIREEMTTIFKQKRDLGLIPALKNNKNEIIEFSREVDFIFLLANHDPDSSKLYSILKGMQKEYRGKTLRFGLKFCGSNFMGYSLYKENVYSFNDFMERFKKQISCN